MISTAGVCTGLDAGIWSGVGNGIKCLFGQLKKYLEFCQVDSGWDYQFYPWCIHWRLGTGLDWIKANCRGNFGGLGAIVKVPLNGVIAMLNGMLEGVNWVIRKINGISFKNPFTGKKYDFNLPTIGSVPYLAKGGVLSQGSAVVGEAGPELLTMTGSSAVVQPLTHATTNNSYLGGMTINIYGAPGQSEEELADLVADRIQENADKKGAVFA